MKLTEKDVLEATRINEVFASLDEMSKVLALTYLSALRDLQMSKKITEQPT